jgi:hypothetical protein
MAHIKADGLRGTAPAPDAYELLPTPTKPRPISPRRLALQIAMLGTLSRTTPTPALAIDFELGMSELGLPPHVYQNLAMYAPYFPSGAYVPPPFGCEITQVNIVRLSILFMLPIGLTCDAAPAPRRAVPDRQRVDRDQGCGCQAPERDALYRPAFRLYQDIHLQPQHGQPRPVRRRAVVRGRSARVRAVRRLDQQCRPSVRARVELAARGRLGDQLDGRVRRREPWPVPAGTLGRSE